MGHFSVHGELQQPRKEAHAANKVNICSREWLLSFLIFICAFHSVVSTWYTCTFDFEFDLVSILPHSPSDHLQHYEGGHFTEEEEERVEFLITTVWFLLFLMINNGIYMYVWTVIVDGTHVCMNSYCRWGNDGPCQLSLPRVCYGNVGFNYLSLHCFITFWSDTSHG